MWIDDFEMDDFEEQIHHLYLQILPLYKQLHAYVRRRLSSNYNQGDNIAIESDGLLPAHILGNVESLWDPKPHENSLTHTKRNQFSQ